MPAVRQNNAGYSSNCDRCIRLSRLAGMHNPNMPSIIITANNVYAGMITLTVTVIIRLTETPTCSPRWFSSTSAPESLGQKKQPRFTTKLLCTYF